MTAWSIPLPRVSQHARQFLGMDWEDEATVGARLQRLPHEGLLSRVYQYEKRCIRPRCRTLPIHALLALVHHFRKKGECGTPSPTCELETVLGSGARVVEAD